MAWDVEAAAGLAYSTSRTEQWGLTPYHSLTVMVTTDMSSVTPNPPTASVPTTPTITPSQKLKSVMAR